MNRVTKSIHFWAFNREINYNTVISRTDEDAASIYFPIDSFFFFRTTRRVSLVSCTIIINIITLWILLLRRKKRIVGIFHSFREGVFVICKIILFRHAQCEIIIIVLLLYIIYIYICVYI